METLASQLTSTLRLPSMVSVSFNGRLSSSIVLTKPSSRVHTFRCSALSSPSLVDQSERFSEASKKGNLIPLYRTIFSDHLTPVLAYRCLVKEADIDAPSFLFESVEPGLRACSIGRNSVVGAQPAIEIVAKENMVTILDHEEGCRTEEIVEDPKIVPQRLMEGWTPQLVDELPEAFCGRWVGFFSYDSVRYVEKKKLPFSSAPLDDRNIPDVHLGLYDDVIVFDHVEKYFKLDLTFTLCNRFTLANINRSVDSNPHGHNYRYKSFYIL
ncbi:anthranilate synthase alpha subunit 2, chloroplastic [Morus notabilis]|uniref:anthranilate synthase alpha subunit 2, chloroplastic n=1 Tax=Morus notabilis TaxID=981085 RepID=UPI000CED7BE7|nr:anthranilate synthase alpha subunit 2, chloroplastic [Morus notabilis]